MKNLIIIGICVFQIAASPYSGIDPANEYVGFSISLKEKSVKAGGSGTLLISLQPQKGIHVNVNPPITIAFDSSDIVAPVGKLEIPRIDTLLNTSKPIKQTIRVSRQVKSGTAAIKGTITYFYCSESEGWCSRFKQPFDVAIKVKK